MDNIEEVKLKIKSMIEKNYIAESTELLKKLIISFPTDLDLYSMLTVCLINDEKYKEAIEICNLGMEIELNNFDLNYNLAYIYEALGEYEKAVSLYRLAMDTCKDEELEIQLRKIITNLIKDIDIKSSKRIVFFVKDKMDSFLGDIISSFSKEYIVKKIIVNSFDQIDKGMEWADICWFEWCDELLIYASKIPAAVSKKVICRLHSYEAFTDYPTQINWKNVNHLIVDTNHIYNIVKDKVNLNEKDVSIIPVGIDIKKFRYKKRKKGKNVAFLGYINYKKGPMLLLQFINALVNKDKEYKLHIGGVFQDERDKLYFNQMIKELKLEENIIFHGWVEDANQWLEEMNYVISTSVLEGQHLSVMEGMTKGIKPIIHNFYGAKQVYKEEYVWNTIEEAVEMVLENTYNSSDYYNYIKDNYSNEKIIKSIKVIFTELLSKKIKEEQPLITIGIPNYNYSQYLDCCINSILNQTYENIEIIIIDDLSTDDSREKIINYSKKFSNISYIFHEKNSGACLEAFNETLRIAKGEYLIMLSADDMLASKYNLENLVSYIKEYNVDYVYGNFDIVDKNGKKVDKWMYKQYRKDEVIKATFDRCGSGIMPLTGGMYSIDYFRKNNLKFENYMNNTVAWDTLNTLIGIKNNMEYKYVNEAFFSYRHHGNNMTNKLNERVISLISNVEYIVNNFNESIYLSEVNWTEVNERDRESLKNYLIATVYYNEIVRIINNQWNPVNNGYALEKKELVKNVIPMVDIIDKYLSKVTSETYFDEVKNLKEKIKKYIA